MSVLNPAPGMRFGPYEILAPIGAGGMGEVYRARDPRLGREVAVKILPPAFAADADRLRRFEQEARATSLLNHPNIVAIYDVGKHDESPYVVSELLEGDTLRNRLRGTALSPRKAIDYALQIAHGLAAAHEKGIVHRDLKPDNLFVTRDGRVKILDFGLAKLTHQDVTDSERSSAATVSETALGAVMGTVGYMSPEQVRGQTVDHRSDIFAFGATLYEMLSGKRAFQADSAVETMNAILKDDPTELSEINRMLPPALDRVVRHCLEKNPEERFQSARDLAFDLETISGQSGPSGTARTLPPAPPKNRSLPVMAGLALLVGVALISFVGGERVAKTTPPSFQQLTFRRGFIPSARFTPDGQTVVYGAAWNGDPIQLFSARLDSPESRSLGLPHADILAISSAGEMAISMGRHFIAGYESIGTLARAPLAGGAPREILEAIREADWGRDGTNLAVVREVAGKTRLEYPIGEVLYETPGWISHPRVSPKQNLVAFLDHPLQLDDQGTVALVDLSGTKRTLSRNWTSVWGLAWSPTGDELWFTATEAESARSLYAITLTGRQRLVARVAGTMTLQDIARNGRVLLTHDNDRREIVSLAPGETKEQNLSWLDWSYPMDLSADGRTILFEEQRHGARGTYAVYLRSTDGAPAVRLGEGSALALSPDGKWALAILPTSPRQLGLLPTGPGEPRPIPRQVIEEYRGASWFPDGKRILVVGNEPAGGVRCYVLDIDGKKPRPITPEGTGRGWITPDSKFVAARDASGNWLLYPVEGAGEPRLIPGLTAADRPIRWSADGQSLYVQRREESAAKVYRLDMTTGDRQLWKEIVPPDFAGVIDINPILLTPDGKSYAYSYKRILSDLYVVDGLK